MAQLHEDEIRQISGDQQRAQMFFDQLARALTSGDLEAIASLWEVPAYVISDEGVHVVRERDEILKFFAGAKAQYNEHHVTDTRAEITRLEWLTNKILLVDVRWPWLDADGNEVGDESSTYALRRDDDGNLRLRITVMRGASQEFH